MNEARAAEKLYLEGGRKVDAGLERLDRNWDNMLAGQRWSAGNAHRNADDMRLCKDYLKAAVDLYGLRLPVRKWLEWTQKALDLFNEIESPFAAQAERQLARLKGDSNPR